jgi:hypothetical protein
VVRVQRVPRTRRKGVQLESSVPEAPKAKEAGPFGCLTVVAVVVVLALGSCALLIAAFHIPDAPIETTSRTEYPSPQGAYSAVVYERWQALPFLGHADWVDLAIRRGSEERPVACLGDGTVEWEGDHQIRITISRRPCNKFTDDGGIFDTNRKTFDVQVLFHLSDNLRSNEYRKQLWKQEQEYFTENPKRKELCRTIYRNWQTERHFDAWAREAADNGEPDPGPWVSTLFPADCSKLPEP